MIKVGDRVRHSDINIDKTQGVMTVLEIKNGYAFCAHMDYARMGSGQWTYPLTDLKLA